MPAILGNIQDHPQSKRPIALEVSGQAHHSAHTAMSRNTVPTLSLVICSRNDDYMGNSLYRLQTSLNYLALQVSLLHREDDVEVIVTDWGSEIPLRQAIALTPDAAKITHFIEVPPALALSKQQDSPFAEVFANNAAIRRARGIYIGRIDQDTLVGRRFLLRFFERVKGRRDNSFAIDSSFLFVGRFRIPLKFVRESPGLEKVAAYIETFKSVLPRDGIGHRPWFDAPVGIAMMHRDLWHACRGYDERLIYWGFMETDLGTRISRHYTVVNLAPVTGCEFFHLSHSGQRFKVTNRKKNSRAMPRSFRPNNKFWGLIQHKFDLQRAVPHQNTLSHGSTPEWETKNLRARYRLDIIRECLLEAGLAGMRFCRMLIHGDRIQPPPKSSRAVSKEEVDP